jgi:DNA-binding Xre family transcriptional regulator
MRAKEKQRVQEVLFRERPGTKCDIPELSKRTGIPKTTLHRYKNEPDLIPLGRLFVICKGMGLTPEEIGHMITG